MTNIVGELYENDRGEFFIKITDDDQLVDYCEEHDYWGTHEDIQDFYEKLGFTAYLDADRMIAIHRANKQDHQTQIIRDLQFK